MNGKKSKLHHKFAQTIKLLLTFGNLNISLSLRSATDELYQSYSLILLQISTGIVFDSLENVELQILL